MIEFLMKMKELSEMFSDGKVTRDEAHKIVDFIYDMKQKKRKK